MKLFASAKRISGLLITCIIVVIAVARSSGESREAVSGNVDLLLVLALDVSASIDESEYELMRGGLANALSSPQVFNAIQGGRNSTIAIAVLQWSGFQEQALKIDWTRVSTRKDLSTLAAKVAAMKRRYKQGATDIGGAISFSRKLISTAPFASSRRTIDIAGDGTNNVNSAPYFERDAAIRSGITINGLAVVGEAFTLVEFYKRFVIGGKGAFVESARDYDSFQTAMLRKLVREIGASYLF